MAVDNGCWFENQDEVSGAIQNLDEDGNLIGSYVIFPTSDPSVVGAVWNDNGTLTVSAG